MMNRVIRLVLLAAFALSGCAGNPGAREDSATSGATAAQSPWTSDSYFIAPPP
jgi:predicted small secreted protein